MARCDYSCLHPKNLFSSALTEAAFAKHPLGATRHSHRTQWVQMFRCFKGSMQVRGSGERKKFFPINWGLGCERAALSPAYTPTFSFPPPWGGIFKTLQYIQ